MTGSLTTRDLILRVKENQKALQEVFDKKKKKQDEIYESKQHEL